MTREWNVTRHTISNSSLCLKFSRVPWDEVIFGVPVGNIDEFKIFSVKSAGSKFLNFEKWLEDFDIHFCCARLPHRDKEEIFFLQERGFRFVELNYRPEKEISPESSLNDNSMSVRPSTRSDLSELLDLASQIYTFGRFHDDPRIGPRLGNKRYRSWMQDILSDPTRPTYLVCKDGDPIAFFACQETEKSSVHWDLNGMYPDYSGKGLAKNAWLQMMLFHAREGFKIVSTSISSHNAIVHNLYVKLGFSFPEPMVTLQLLRKPLGKA